MNFYFAFWMILCVNKPNLDATPLTPIPIQINFNFLNLYNLSISNKSTKNQSKYIIYQKKHLLPYPLHNQPLVNIITTLYSIHPTPSPHPLHFHQFHQPTSVSNYLHSPYLSLHFLIKLYTNILFKADSLIENKTFAMIKE